MSRARRKLSVHSGDQEAAEAFAALPEMERHPDVDDAEYTGAQVGGWGEMGAMRMLEERKRHRRSLKRWIKKREGRSSPKPFAFIAGLRQRIAVVSDKVAFDAAIAADMKTVTNETASPGLAAFLGNLAKEVRTMGAPDYVTTLREDIDDLDEEGVARKRTVSLVKRSEAKAEGREGREWKDKEVNDGDDDDAVTNEKEDGKNKTGNDTKQEGGWKECDKGAASENSGAIFAASMIGSAMMLSIAFGMARASNDTIRKHTLFIIDQATVIFLAVLWFQAFDSFMNFRDIEAQNKFILCALYGVTALSVSVTIAFLFRKSGITLAIICGCLSHFLSMTSALAGFVLQRDVFVASWSNPAMAVLCMICMMAFFMFIGVVIWCGKRAVQVDNGEDFMNQTDNLENSFGAIASAFCFNLIVRFVFSGYHPIGQRDGFKQTQRAFMLAHCVVALILAGVVHILTQRVRNATYMVKRGVVFADAFLSMNVGWAWILWGEWEFYEPRFGTYPIFGKIMFALAVSLAVAALTVGLAQVETDGDMTGQVPQVAMGLVIAWSWAACFDDAVRDFKDDNNHTVPFKLFAAAALTATILPVYALYFKPLTIISGKAGSAV